MSGGHTGGIVVHLAEVCKIDTKFAAHATEIQRNTHHDFESFFLSFFVLHGGQRDLIFIRAVIKDASNPDSGIQLF